MIVRAPRFAAAWALFGWLALAGGLPGCEDETGPMQEVDRSEVAPLPDGSWQSSPWDVDEPLLEGLIEIPPGTRMRLLHGLGHVPVEIHAYVGFSADDPRLMPATGNAVEIREVTEESVTIRNGSGGSFFYRFVLR